MIKILVQNRKIIWFSIYFYICLICVLPSLFLFKMEYINSFMWVPLTNVALMQNNVLNYTNSAYDIIIYSISELCGIPLIQLATFPIGTFIVPMFYFAFSNKLHISKISSLLFVIYMSYDFTLYPLQYNLFSYTWCHSLFLSFLILYINYIYTSDPCYVVPIIMIFLTTFHMHPTYSLWMMAFSVILSTMILAFNKIDERKHQLHIKSTYMLSTLIVTVYLGFSDVLYKGFLKRSIESDPIREISGKFLPIICSYIGINYGNTSIPANEYEVTASATIPMIGYSTSLRLIIILIILFIVSIYWLYNKNRFYLINYEDFFLATTLISVGLIHTAAYAIYGHMSFRYIVFIYPIILAFLLEKFFNKKIQILFILTIVLLGFIQTASFYVNYDVSAHADIENPKDIKLASDWLFNNDEETFEILTSATSLRAIGFLAAVINRSYSNINIDLKKYTFLVDYKNNNFYINKNLFDYLFINMYNPFSTGLWQSYKPLANYKSQLENNIYIIKIYTIDKINIFKWSKMYGE